MFFRKKIFYPAQLILFFLLSFTTLAIQAADKETFKPYALAKQTAVSMADAQTELKKQIINSPFSLLSEYSPYSGAHIFIITSDELKSLAAKSPYGGFAAAQRISLTQVDKNVQVAYTNPVFMKHAYRMKEVDMQPILKQMTKAFGFDQFFGGDGLSARKLKRYKYSFGLEDFDSFYELPEYESHTRAIAALEKGFKQKDNGITEIYKIKIPGKKQVVYGVAMSAEDSGIPELDTKKTMDIIDHLALKRTAYLPYEIMVDGNNIIAMHARFRIAVNYSDLKMFGKHGFGKLFSTPGAYQKAFYKVAGGKEKKAAEGFIE